MSITKKSDGTYIKRVSLILSTDSADGCDGSFSRFRQRLNEAFDLLPGEVKETASLEFYSLEGSDYVENAYIRYNVTPPPHEVIAFEAEAERIRNRQKDYDKRQFEALRQKHGW